MQNRGSNESPALHHFPLRESPFTTSLANVIRHHGNGPTRGHRSRFKAEVVKKGNEYLEIFPSTKCNNFSLHQFLLTKLEGEQHFESCYLSIGCSVIINLYPDTSDCYIKFHIKGLFHFDADKCRQKGFINVQVWLQFCTSKFAQM